LISLKPKSDLFDGDSVVLILAIAPLALPMAA
jgi:hypothetical protein